MLAARRRRPGAGRRGRARRTPPHRLAGPAHREPARRRGGRERVQGARQPRADVGADPQRGRRRRPTAACSSTVRATCASPGPDGLVNTADDGALAARHQARARRPARHGRRRDARRCSGFTREIEIRDIGPIAAPAARDRRATARRRAPRAVRPHDLPFRLCVSTRRAASRSSKRSIATRARRSIGHRRGRSVRSTTVMRAGRHVADHLGDEPEPAGRDEPDGARLHPDRPGHSDRRHSDPVRRTGAVAVNRPAPGRR